MLPIRTFPNSLLRTSSIGRAHGEVSKENQPEVTLKSFGEADLEWIASVTGIDYKYREWTSFTLDEDVKPSPDFKKACENVSRAFHMRTEVGRRIFLNLFLSDIILLPESKNSLRKCLLL